MIIQATIIFIAILFGYFLRGLKEKKIQENVEEKVSKVKKKVFPPKSTMIEYRPPTSEEKEAERIAREKMKT